MTTWTRATQTTLCGGCPRQIHRGEPMTETRVHGVRRIFKRCQVCAGGAPPDLPPLVEAPSNTFEPVRVIAERVAPDFKQRQLGEDA